MNPKSDLIIEHVSESDIAEVFGGKGVKPFKITNNMLHLATRKALLLLCWRIYRTISLANNDIMAWIVKRLVVDQKGMFKINWAVAVASTVAEKNRRDLVIHGKTLLSNVVSIDLTDGSCDRTKLSTKSSKDVGRHSFGVLDRIKQKDSSSCPFLIAEGEVKKVEVATNTASEHYNVAKSRGLFLEGLLKMSTKKLVGLRFNWEDCLIASKEDKQEPKF